MKAKKLIKVCTHIVQEVFHIIWKVFSSHLFKENVSNGRKNTKSMYLLHNQNMDNSRVLFLVVEYTVYPEVDPNTLVMYNHCHRYHSDNAHIYPGPIRLYEHASFHPCRCMVCSLWKWPEKNLIKKHVFLKFSYPSRKDGNSSHWFLSTWK